MAPDMTRQAEEAYNDRRSPRGRSAAPARGQRPDPRTLAKNYLARTEFDPEALVRNESLIKEAGVILRKVVL